jgi:3'-phosphoadenosine 5'-phosphosulfate sulfotransferase (PAPS reductase)/FAD synthetase
VNEKEFNYPLMRLRQLQGLSLKAKLERAQTKIFEFVGAQPAYISWSGGLDSRLVLHLVRDLCGISKDRCPAVFIDTGLEYPEVRDCALRHADIVLKPKMNFKQVIERYGYPVISKRVSQYVHEVQVARKRGNGNSATCTLRMTGKRTDGTHSKMGKLSDCWQYLCDAPFKCSSQCCGAIKKTPAATYALESGRRPILGLRAADGQQRELTFLSKRGGACNAFGEKGSSWPVALFTDQDVQDAVKEQMLDHPDIYDERTLPDGTVLSGATGSGCMFCMFGVHMEKPINRFQRMKQTHPQKWAYCMNQLGLREVLNYLKVKTGDEITNESDPLR